MVKSIYNVFGPLTRSKPNVDQEEWPCIRSERVDFYLYVCPKRAVLKKKFKFDLSLVFSCLPPKNEYIKKNS